MREHRFGTTWGLLLGFLIATASGVLAQEDNPFGDAIANDPLDDAKKNSPARTKTSAKKTAGKTGDKHGATPAWPPKRPVDPKLMRLFLRDGSVITGKFAVDEITVQTEFGRLTVPVTRLNSFKPGLESLPELHDEIKTLIAGLNAEDFKQREKVQQALIKMGPTVRGQLRQAMTGKSAERDRRIKAILEKLDVEAENSDSGEEADTTEWIRDDIVRTTEFTIVGKISPREFNVTSRWGMLKIKLADIKQVRREHAEKQQDEQRKITLTGANLAQLKFKSSGIQVYKGDRISVKADGTLSRNGSRSYRSTPDGTSRFGYYTSSPQILGGSLVARIGRGKVFRVGSNGTVTATRGGVLRFAIGMRPDYVGRYQFIGQYNVRIKVQRGGG